MYYNDIVLIESLKNMNLKIYKSKPFGNCFFNSISKYMRMSKNIHISGNNIRKNLIQYIEDNSFVINYLQNIGGMSIEDISCDLVELKKSGVYDLDIFDFIPVIIATQYNLKISIYTWIELSDVHLEHKDKETYYPIKNKKTSGEVILLYSNLEHYDLLYPCE